MKNEFENSVRNGGGDSKAPTVGGVGVSKPHIP
jgi:hypothetical protein